MTAHRLDQADRCAVEKLLRQTADLVHKPAFGRLRTDQIRTKNSGELVTDVDTEAEQLLTRGLQTILRADVVGEEAVAVGRSSLEHLRTASPVWIVDPLDGTANFVAGHPGYSMLVTLAEAGLARMSWTYAPEPGVLATAVRGGGAKFSDRSPTTVAKPNDPPDVAAADPVWWTPAIRHCMRSLSRASVTLTSFDAAGVAYLDLALGKLDALILTWDAPWDHHAGLLLAEEAGCVVRRPDGLPIRTDEAFPVPLVAARTAELAARLIGLLTTGA